MTTSPSSAAPLNDPRDAEPAATPQPDTARRLRLVELVPPATRTASRSGPDRRRSSPARRVLHPHPLVSLAEYQSAGGLRGLEIACEMAPAEIAATVLDSGLRGRGGAGFPTGRKWQTVAANATAGQPATVVVNGAEGEPGTFKDRSILRRNPYQIIEGAFIAARPTHADPVVIALKASFAAEVERIRAALAEMRAARALPAAIGCAVFEGTDEYLYGEESALLEAIDGRGPFPRVVPPYRVGLLGEHPHGRVGAGPALVNNAETIANVPGIVARGAQWFRALGTPDSPGTVVCTVTGDLQRHGVGRDPHGHTPAPHPRHHRRWTGRPGQGRSQRGGQPGHPRRPTGCPRKPRRHAQRRLRTRLSRVHRVRPPYRYGRRRRRRRPVPVGRVLRSMHPVQDRRHRADHPPRSPRALERDRRRPRAIEHRVGTVDYGARCYLASQQEAVLASILTQVRDEFHAHLTGAAPPAEPALIAELVDIRDGVAVIDQRHRHKQTYWSFAPRASGSTPAELRIRFRSTPAR